MRILPESTTLTSPEQSGLREVVFTVGDPNGIGPEVLLKALADPRFRGGFHPVIFGPSGYLRKLCRELGLGELPPSWELRGDRPFDFPPAWGRIDPVAGGAAWGWLEAAVEYCLAKKSPLLITAPIHKQAIRQAGFPYPGHTEFLADRFGRKQTSMAFFSERLVVALVTIHLPLRRVPEVLTAEAICSTAAQLRSALQASGVTSPRLALCGLNPHASEGGLFGDEEARVLEPAVRQFRQRFGGGLAGPFPSDTLFHRAAGGEFDGVIALYHDQGLIPVKLLSFDSSTNVTLGLPLMRTSPDHGTAFDIAGQNRAHPGSMIASIQWGLRLAGMESPSPRPADGASGGECR